MYVFVSTIDLLNLDKYFLNFAKIVIIILYRSFLYFLSFFKFKLNKIFCHFFAIMVNQFKVIISKAFIIN